MTAATEESLIDPAVTTESEEVHISCCRRPNVTLCGDDADQDPVEAEPTCAFCHACVEEDDYCEEHGLTICCQIDGRPCPEEYQP